ANWDAQNGSQGNQQVTDVAIADGAVVSAPVVHYRIDIVEGTFTRERRSKPSGGPSGIGPQVKDVVHVLRQLHRVALGNLEHRSQTLHQVEARHGHRQFALGRKRGRESAAPK